MSKDPTRVRVALTGNVWFESDLTATIQSNIMQPPTATAKDLGYTTDDGVTFSIARETNEIPGWQAMEALRVLVTAEPRSAQFTLRQMERQSWLTTMGGKVTELVAAVPADPGPAALAIYRWEPDIGKLPEGMLFIDMDDELPSGVQVRYRYGFRRATQSDAVEFNLKRTDAVNLPNTWKALAPVGGLKSFYADTNDPSFAAA